VKKSLSGGVIKTHYAKGNNISRDKSIGERLSQRTALEKEREENTVATSEGDGPTWSYAQ
jgi:hypothetical protein